MGFLEDIGEVGSAIIGGALALGGAALAVFSAGTLASVGIGLASFGLGLIERSVRLSQLQDGVQQNVTSSVAGLPVIYGRAKVGGKVVDTRVDGSTDENKDLYRVLAFCVGSEDGTGVEEYEEIKFDERAAVSAPNFQTLSDGINSNHSEIDPFWEKDGDWVLDYGLYAGTDSQTVDSKLNALDSAAWPSSSEGKGISYAAFLLRFDEDKFASGIPNVTATIKGQHVYDPRDSTWKWSDNPILCLLDYLTSERYGAGLTYTQRDGGTEPTEIDEASFIDAANYAEVTVTYDENSNAQARFSCNGWLNTADRLKRNINSLLSSCRGELVYQNGKVRIIVRRQKNPTTFSLDETNIIGDWEWHRSGSEKVPNAISVQYNDSGEDFNTLEETWPKRDQNDFLPSDNDIPKTREMDLPMTDDDITARQIAMVTLKELREDASIAVTCTEAALQLEVGDVVPLSHPTPGWTDKEFWVMGMSINPDHTVRLALKEYSDSAYSLSPLSDRPSTPGTNLPDPFSITAPTNLSAGSGSGTSVEFSDGTVQPRALATWTAPSDAFFKYAEVQYRGITDADNSSVSENWQTAPLVRHDDDQQVYLDQVKNGWEYEVRVRAINQIGVKSAWVTTNVTISATGGHYPIIKLTTSESGGDGTVTAEVIDPAGTSNSTINFYKRVGQSGFPGTPDQQNTGVSSSGTASFTTSLDSSRNTFVKVEAILDSNGNSSEKIATLDSDTSANIDNIGASVDEDTGEVVVSIDGDSDAAKHYITVGQGSVPADPDGTDSQADATLNSRSGTVNTGVTVPRGTTVYVKARPQNSAGDLAPADHIRLATTSYGEKTAGHPIILVDTSEATDGSTGSLTATVIDPDGGNLTVRFFTRQGHESYGSADATFTAVPSGTGKSQNVTLVEKKNSWIKVEAEVESNGLKNSKEVAFDPNDTPLVTSLSADIANNGQIAITSAGDSDTDHIDIEVTGDLTESLTIPSRSGTVSTSGSIDPGETVTITATPVSASSTSGQSVSIEKTRGEGEQTAFQPTISIDVAPQSIPIIKDITFTGELGANGAGPVKVEYRINGGSWNREDSPFTRTFIPELDRDKVIQARAVDTGQSPEVFSDVKQVTIPGLRIDVDIPGVQVGDRQSGFQETGIPGENFQSPRIRTPDGLTDLLDPSTQKFFNVDLDASTATVAGKSASGVKTDSDKGASADNDLTSLDTNGYVDRAGGAVKDTDNVNGTPASDIDDGASRARSGLNADGSMETTNINSGNLPGGVQSSDGHRIPGSIVSTSSPSGSAEDGTIWSQI